MTDDARRPPPTLADDLEAVRDEHLPEAVRVVIAQQAFAAREARAQHDLDARRLDLERRRMLLNMPLVVTLSGLVSLAVSFLFDQQRAGSAAEIEAVAREREFQYELVSAQLADETQTQAERAAALDFLVEAGVLTTLNGEYLKAVAEEAAGAEEDRLPVLRSREAARPMPQGTAIPLDDLRLDHPAHAVARGLGHLVVDDAVRCNAVLADRDEVAFLASCAPPDAASAVLRLYDDVPEGADRAPIEVEVSLPGRPAGVNQRHVVAQLRDVVPGRFAPLSLPSTRPEERPYTVALVHRDFADGRAFADLACSFNATGGYHFCIGGSDRLGGPPHDRHDGLRALQRADRQRADRADLRTPVGFGRPASHLRRNRRAGPQGRRRARLAASRRAARWGAGWGTGGVSCGGGGGQRRAPGRGGPGRRPAVTAPGSAPRHGRARRRARPR